MITLKDLAAILQDQIEEEIERAPITFTLGEGSYARTERYEFHIDTDTGDYMPPTRDGNTVTKYIQGVLLESGSEIEQTATGKFNGTFSAQLEVLCPIIEGDELGLANKRLVDTVREVLTNIFVNNSVKTQSDEAGNSYTVGTFYSMVNSGMRQIVPQVGDSFTFSVALTFFVVQNGVSSKNIVFEVDDEKIGYITLGMRRDAVTDQNVSSNTSDGATTSNVDSSALVIQLTAPALDDKFTKTIMGITLDGRKSAEAHRVVLRYPYMEDEPQEMQMYITSATVNAQGTKNASLEATFSQAMDLGV